jgi:hypothetical protein
MDFWKELCLSGVGGLTWLSFNYPRFARKILYTLLVCCVLMKVGLRIYQWGYKDCQAHIANEFERRLSKVGPLKGKKGRLDIRIIATLQGSSGQMDREIEKYGFYLDIAGAILLVLIFFCIRVGFDKKSDRCAKNIPAATGRDS